MKLSRWLRLGLFALLIGGGLPARLAAQAGGAAEPASKPTSPDPGAQAVAVPEAVNPPTPAEATPLPPMEAAPPAASVQTPPTEPAMDDPLRYALLPQAIVAAQDIAREHSLDPQWVSQQIASARYLEQVTRLVMPPQRTEQKNWGAYRARFTDAARIAAGRRFWEAHRDSLQRAQDRYGVPASLIVGVLGVESIYGQQTGRFRVIDVLCTLAFDFPSAHPRAQARQAFFREELGAFLKLAQRDGMDPQSVRGSYAGALGWPQFMPGSWLRHAVDFDGDGRIDLFNSPVDAIGSVARYFQAYGWQRDLPTHYPVSFDPQRLDMAALLAPDIVPSFSPEAFIARGAVLGPAAATHPGKLALIELHNGGPASGEPPTYVAGTENFFVVTRYNWSSYYAMAVIDLGQRVESTLSSR